MTTTSRILIVGLVSLAGASIAGCSLTGAQQASAQPKGVAPAATVTKPVAAKPMNEPGATARGNPMPSWVLAEAETLVSQQSTPAKSLAQAMDGGRPAISTLAAPMEDGITMTDGMEGLTRVSFAEEGSDFDPCMSPDGRTLVFASTQHRATSDIYIKNVNSRTVTQLTADPGNDIMPTLSPDGKKIAFSSDRTGSWKVYVMSTQGGQAVQLTSDTAPDLHPSFSPDGKRLVFCRLGQMSGRWELWVLDVSQPANAEFIGYGMFPRWSPVAGTGESGSDKIVFQRGRERGDRAFGLWTVDYKPGSVSNVTEVVSQRGFAAINPSWSPDGQWIAYSSVPAAGNTPRNAGESRADLWIASISGSARVNISGGKFANFMPSWSSDGRVYFVSNRGGSDNIWSVSTQKALAAAGNATPSNHTASSAGAHAPADSAVSDKVNGESTATVPTP